MKPMLTLVALTMLVLISACAGPNQPGAGSPQEPVNPPATETSQPNNPVPIVVTSLPQAGAGTGIALPELLPSLTPSLNTDGGKSIPESGVTLDDNNATFNLHVGNSFLLNLGTDMYDWTVSVDKESVLRMKMGVMVIKGTQGIYDVLAPGTAILTATGDPLCRKSKPVCGAPSIVFIVTLVVK